MRKFLIMLKNDDAIEGYRMVILSAAVTGRWFLRSREVSGTLVYIVC